MTGYHVKRTQVADTSTAHHLHDRLATPDSDPDRWLPEEVTLFRSGRCSWQAEYGNGPSIGYCGVPSEPGASFGNCADHNEELPDGFYPDGAPREAEREAGA